VERRDMKYKLAKDLPFLKAGSILQYGCWVGGGLGVDMGETKYAGGGSSHNGVRTFESHENTLLESLFDNKEWLEKQPDTIDETLDLYDSDYFSREEVKIFLKWVP
jgi:hypothetical protein